MVVVEEDSVEAAEVALGVEEETEEAAVVAVEWASAEVCV